MGASQPRTTTAVIMPKPDLSSSYSSQRKASFRVAEYDRCMEALERNPRQRHRKTIARWLQDDLYTLNFTPRELRGLVDAFRTHADLTTAHGQSMSLSTFVQVVHVLPHNSTEEAELEGRTANPALVVEHLEVLTALFSQMDENLDGSLDLREFLLGFSYWRGQLASSSDRLLFAFSLFDTSRDGVLDKDEFLSMLIYMLQTGPRRLGFEDEQMRESVSSVVQAAFAEADVNGDGCIEVSELMEWLARKPEMAEKIGHDEQSVRALFSLFDLDSSGTLSPSQFTALLLRSTDIALNSDDMRDAALVMVDDVFAAVDKNKDGTISFEEFKRWVTHEPESSNHLLAYVSAPVSPIGRDGALAQRTSIKIRPSMAAPNNGAEAVPDAPGTPRGGSRRARAATILGISQTSFCCASVNNVVVPGSPPTSGAAHASSVDAGAPRAATDALPSEGARA